MGWFVSLPRGSESLPSLLSSPEGVGRIGGRKTEVKRLSCSNQRCCRGVANGCARRKVVPWEVPLRRRKVS